MNLSLDSRKTTILFTQFFIAMILLSCSGKKEEQFESELKSLALAQGEITLCGSGADQFGSVDFGISCSEKVRADFNLATALLHSFEYTEAEKVFARIIHDDQKCIMAYWGAAMCNFHPLWEAPSEHDLQKGTRIISLARSLVEDQSSKESDYLEAIATIYDHWDSLDHHTRVIKFEKASQLIYEKSPNDNEAAIFYALALRASADPKDKSFTNQKKAGQILNKLFESNPNHPGVAHYIIHNFDYPELADLALPAAKKYASIAAASAHAQHMPSHIFTRLGLWDESIQSNINSISAAQCYAQNMNMKGHWDEELHGMDYLVYAYLQKGDDATALEQMEYLNTITEVFPLNFKVFYSFASIPTRYALERKDWTAAANLELSPAGFTWEKFPWEKSNVNLGRLLGAIHTNHLTAANHELKELQRNYEQLLNAKENYKASLVNIQLKIGEGWIRFAEGKKAEAITLLMAAADMEDATEKHPVTPGEIIPARELLGDMYLAMGESAKALEAYEANLKRHQNRFNGIYGAGLAAEQSKDFDRASMYYKKLLALSNSTEDDRPALQQAKSFLNVHQ